MARIFCCKCCFENDGRFDDRKFYRLPLIKATSLAEKKVIEEDYYCEECLQEWLKEYEVEEE